VRVVRRSGGGGASGQSARVGGSRLTCARRSALPPLPALPALLARPNPHARALARPLAPLGRLLGCSERRALWWRALWWRALCGRVRPGRLPPPPGRSPPPPGRFRSRRLLPRRRLLPLRTVRDISPAGDWSSPAGDRSSLAGDWSSLAGDSSLSGEESLQLGGPLGGPRTHEPDAWRGGERDARRGRYRGDTGEM
jgi:hypothetical protein